MHRLTTIYHSKGSDNPPPSELPFAQAVNHYLKIRTLSLQSRTNLLCPSSLKIRVWDSAFYVDEYLVRSLYIHYIHTLHTTTFTSQLRTSIEKGKM